MDMDMGHKHDDGTDKGAGGEGIVYVGRFGDAELGEDDRDTLRTAFAALVRTGRPLFGPAPEEGEGALIDPDDPGLNTRVAAILDPDARPHLVGRALGEAGDPDDAGDALVVLREGEGIAP